MSSTTPTRQRRAVPFTQRVPELLKQLHDAYAQVERTALPPPLDGSRALARAWRQARADDLLVWLGVTRTPDHEKKFMELVHAPLVSLRKWENHALRVTRNVRAPTASDRKAVDQIMKVQPDHARWWVEFEVCDENSQIDALKEEYEGVLESIGGATQYLRGLRNTLADERRRRSPRRSVQASPSLRARRAGRTAGVKAVQAAAAPEVKRFLGERCTELWNWFFGRSNTGRAPTQEDAALSLEMSIKTVRKHLRSLVRVGGVKLDGRRRIAEVSAPPKGPAR